MAKEGLFQLLRGKELRVCWGSIPRLD